MNNVDILYQDEHMIAVNKPSGIPVFDSSKNNNHKNLKDILSSNLNKSIFIVHSIDIEASGIIICAKSKEKREFLSSQFKEAKVERKFIALVLGVLENEEGIIKEPIRISDEGAALNKFGKRAESKYKVLERFQNFTLVEIIPITQVRSQIRLHFWSIGYPLAVDMDYAGGEAILLSSFKRNYKVKLSIKEKPLISRLAIHLQSMSLSISANEGQRTFNCDLPSDFKLVIKQLRKYCPYV